MANTKPPTRPKRRLKAAAPTTVRERRSNATAQQPTVKRGWLRQFFRALGWPFRRLAGLSVWQSKAWKPFRKVGHFVGLVLLPRYVRNSWVELRRVTWPNRRETWRLTSAVLLFSIAFGVLIAVLDFGLDKLFREVLIK